MKPPSESVVLTVIGCIAVAVICFCSLGLEYGWFYRYEPTAQEAVQQVSSQTSQVQQGRYNLNTVTVKQLQSLPGVGEELARQIVLFRYNNGGFQSLTQLLQVEGMSEQIYFDILPYITL